MAATGHDQRRYIPVTLQAIPVERRLVAARQACRREDDPRERAAIVHAALYPSNTVYWIAR